MEPGFLSSEGFALVPVQQGIEKMHPSLSTRRVCSVDVGAKGSA